MSATAAGLLQVGLLLALLAVVYRPLGDYLARVYTSTTTLRAERVIYRLVRVDPDAEQRWSTYAASLLGFSAVSIVLLYLLQRLQGWLPLSLARGAVGPGVAFNTAVSFVTNTNWQSYLPEAVLGHLTQMAGLTVQNFLSASVGMAVAVALIRGFVRSGTDRLGNFWVDLTRGVVRILLPLSVLAAVVLLLGGVVMSMRSGVTVIGLDGRASTIALAPAAGQEAIKGLGTNGGGVFAANSAHPFENPSTWTNLFQIFLLLVIPICLTRTFGRMVGNPRQGYALLAVMGLIWAAVLAVTWWAETHPNGAATVAAGAAMEGKEMRFGIASSVLWAVSTTGTSAGAVNSMHDSYTGLGGGMLLLHMMLGEVSPGGVGSGLYGLLIVAVIAVFLAGLMVGRTPEYLGKKISRREITAAALVTLVMPAMVLLGTGAALMWPPTLEAMTNQGAHGLSEVLYAYTSAGNNNGSAFAGLTVTSTFFQSTLAVAMAVGRFVPILAVLCLAGSLAQQKPVPVTAGTLPTTGVLFVVLVTGTVILRAVLTFAPALGLGPVPEALT